MPGGAVDAVVSGVGTGGTIVGLHEAFQEAGCPVTAWVAKPVTGTGGLGDVECCSFSSRVPGVVEGLSRIFVPDRVPGLVEVEIADDLAITTARALIRRGFPVGPSSGLNYAAAVEAASHLGPEAQVVTVFPDRMERYFSTELIRRPATTGAGRSRDPSPPQPR
jgi:cysteine synthase A